MLGKTRKGLWLKKDPILALIIQAAITQVDINMSATAGDTADIQLSSDDNRFSPYQEIQ